jgi:branched-subunit amino acid ABC-type transport system permease component
MSEIVGYIIRGIPFGCVYGLVAIGLVLGYRTSGVFNLAFAAQAYLAAAVFYNLNITHGWPLIPAAFVAAFVISPLVGLVLERGIFRWLRVAPPTARLVATTGVLVALPAVVQVLYGTQPQFDPPVLWPNAFGIYHFGSYSIDATETAIMIGTAAAVIVLGLLLRFTPFGLMSRAVVESPRLTGLTGVNSNRISATSWALSSAFAGLAGVLLAPLFAQIANNYFFEVLVAAIAAAAFARMRSLVLALVGGLLLGILQGVLAGYLPAGSVIANGLRPSLPFVALFLLLLFWAGLGARDLGDPLAGVDPPISLSSAEAATAPPPSRLARVVTIVVVIAIALIIGNHYPEALWLPWLITSTIFTIIFLSITVFTGLGGQVSFCQATFAGIGAYTTAQFATSAGLPVFVAIILGVVFAAGVGALLALPTIRLSGVYLALATLAFALMFENSVQPLSWVAGNSPVPLTVARPSIFGFTFTDNWAFLGLCLAICAVACVAVVLVRKGTTGLTLEALRGSETGSQAIGIDPRRVRVLAFSISAGLAGLGGGLLASFHGAASTADYGYILGLLWVAAVVTLGARSIVGAVAAAVSLAAISMILLHDFIPWLLNSAQPWHTFAPVAPEVATMLFGFGAVTYARNPDGILAAGRRKMAITRSRRVARRSERAAAVVAPETVHS